MKKIRFDSRLLALLTVIIVVLGMLPIVTAQDVKPADKIEPDLQARLTADGQADVIVRFTRQADLSSAYRMNWKDRGDFVYNTLTQVAAKSQANAKAYLDKQGLTYHTFIAGNELYVWGGNQATVTALAEMSEVGYIRLPQNHPLDPIISTKVDDAAPNALEWGVADTNADDFWTAFGVKGDSITVANIDTGVRSTHQALASRYKCGSGPHTNCWADPDNGTTVPTDWHGHGTHTMGTMVGDDGGSNQIGMAPNAQWIACVGCANDTVGCSDYALNYCADWILAPGGSAANRPNIVNNSWGGGGGNNWYLAKINAWRAAGIFPAFSAGNNGEYGCDSLGSPGDYQESFGTAAHDSSRYIAYFSSRGPSSFGHSPYTKPNISAPGVDVRSSMPGSDSEYGYMSGTSMASPHTAGAVALLWSCNPSLIGQIDQTFQILQNTADSPPAGDCGEPGDGGNYTFGYGYLNIYAAGLLNCGSQATPTPTPVPPTATPIVTLPPVTPNTWVHLPIVVAHHYPGSPPTLTPIPTATPIVPTVAPTVPPYLPLQNGDFELGPVYWTEYSQHGWPLIMNGGFPGNVTPHSGVWAVWLGGEYDDVSSISQPVTVPAGQTYLSYYHWIASADYCNWYDYAAVIVNGVAVESYPLCGDVNTGGWVRHSVSLAGYAGQAVTIQIAVNTDSSLNSNLFVDDVAFRSSPSAEEGTPVLFDPATAATRADMLEQNGQ